MALQSEMPPWQTAAAARRLLAVLGKFGVEADKYGLGFPVEAEQWWFLNLIPERQIDPGPADDW